MRTKFYSFLILFVCYKFSVCAKFGNVYLSGNKTDARGFGSYGMFKFKDGKILLLCSIFSLGKVLNFFPVGGERECSPAGFNIAKGGICLNPYDCRQRDGKASGDCAHGLGVCCVFEVTCGGMVQNNITYFMSPGFPELWMGERNCSLLVDRTHAGVTQLRIDFIHFTIGQPNRLTGECDEDTMVLGEGANNFTLCGQNHGQHIYYTLPTGNETREEGELPRSRSTPLVITMRGSEMPRLWLMRITQVPLAYSSPHNCLQYYTKDNGTIKTFNYASNGRHLAGQEYRTCVRKNAGMCSIKYIPCDRRSFRIGSRGGSQMNTYGVSGPIYGPPTASTPATTPAVVQNDMTPMNEAPPEMSPSAENDEEGSGQDPQIIDSNRPTNNQAQPGLMSRIWSYILPSWMWEQRSFGRWSPYIQHLDEDRLKYYGYGTYGVTGFGRQRCTDRISIPCESEYFVYGQGLGVCDPYHCGNNFCPGQTFEDCNVQTSIIPFAVSVYFGPPVEKQNPEENIGMCLQYRQIPCDE